MRSDGMDLIDDEREMEDVGPVVGGEFELVETLDVAGPHLSAVHVVVVVRVDDNGIVRGLRAAQGGRHLRRGLDRGTHPIRREPARALQQVVLARDLPNALDLDVAHASAATTDVGQVDVDELVLPAVLFLPVLNPRNLQQVDHLETVAAAHILCVDGDDPVVNLV